jgi:hypothetical protein
MIKLCLTEAYLASANAFTQIQPLYTGLGRVGRGALLQAD